MTDPSENRTGRSECEAVVTERAATRAVPLPEERRAQQPGEDAAVRRRAAEGILADSEERIAGAQQGEAPAAGAEEHRRSEDTA